MRTLHTLYRVLSAVNVTLSVGFVLTVIFLSEPLNKTVDDLTIRICIIMVPLVAMVSIQLKRTWDIYANIDKNEYDPILDSRLSVSQSKQKTYKYSLIDVIYLFVSIIVFCVVFYFLTDQYQIERFLNANPFTILIAIYCLTWGAQCYQAILISFVLKGRSNY